MMMDQEEHLIEKGEPKFFTRSTARHLRRKRLHNARRVEKQQEHLTKGVNIQLEQESIAEKSFDQAEVITKSKARRLRQKNEGRLFPNCPFCDPYIPDIETVNNQETVVKDSENTKTITKSKARRLRRKNKNLCRNGCSFCYHVYFSPTADVIAEHMKILEGDSYADADTINKLKCNYNLGKTADAQICHSQYDQNTEQLEANLESISSEENCREVSCFPSSSGFVELENDIEINPEKQDRSKQKLDFVSALSHHVKKLDKIQANCMLEEAMQLGKSPYSSQLPKLKSLVTVDQSTEVCNSDNSSYLEVVEPVNIKSEESITCKIHRNTKDQKELNVLSETDKRSETVATLPLNEQLIENEGILNENDLFKVNSEASARENTEGSFSNKQAENKISAFVVEQNTQSPNCIKEESKIELIRNSCPTVEQGLISLEKESKVVEVELFSAESSLSNPINLSDNSETGKSVVSPSLNLPILNTMSDNKASKPEKTREEIKAEREAKKAAKALAKAKGKSPKVQDSDTTNVKPEPPDSIKKKQANKKPEKQIVKENIDAQSEASSASNMSNNTLVKNVSSDVSNEGKSKAELRADRRAKQEAQREAKQQQLLAKNTSKTKEDSHNTRITPGPIKIESVNKTLTPKRKVPPENAHEINLFKHLYHEREQAIVDVPFVNSNIHPAIVRLGTQYANKVIVGSNARCVALLTAVKQLIKDFERPSQADFIRGLEARLQESVAYLHHCRPIAVSMHNALRHLKWQMTQLSSALSDTDAKSKLSNAIDTYILEQIQLADKAISITIQTKISEGDVILTYGYSSLINKILLEAHTAGKQFRVIVVDGRPWLEGKEQLRRLAKHGIECSYILINALSYVMPGVSKVFLGAHAILANGAVMSRVGTAQVALMARAFNIPVLVACETHKSCERVQTDSIVHNELGNADELVQHCESGTKKPLLANWKTKKFLNLLNITYDVTPADLVTAVVTELAILPCTSVPVILRIKPSEI